MMNIVLDQRPSAELTDGEIVAHLFQALRAQSIKTAEQVQAACKRMFPDLPAERASQCLKQLAHAIDPARA